jgi:hypothetical protein
MSLADTIRNATRPVVANLMANLGSRITIRHPTITRAADGSSIRAWGTPTGGDSIPCKLAYVSIAHVQRVWGMTSDVKVEGMLPINLVTIANGDGVLVVSGFLAGLTFTVEQSVPDDLGQYVMLGLQEGRGVIA